MQGLGGRSPDVLLGADVVCWPNFVAPFLQTVKRLLMPPPDPGFPARVLYLGFVCRATVTRDIFLTTAREMGMKVEKMPSPDIPESERDSVISSLELELLKVTLDPVSESATISPVMSAPEGVEAPC